MKNYLKFGLFCILLSTLCVPANASYLAILDDGKIIKKGEYQVMLSPQFLLSGNTGVDVGALFDFGFNDSSNFRAVVGTGSTSFYSGLSYKWIPIPDLTDQPAIGIRTGFTYGVQNSNSSLSFRLEPLISKKFIVDWADITPYAAIPFGTTAYQGVTTYPLQLALGVELKPAELKRISFFGEVGFNLSSSFSYISLAAAVQFDDQNGLKFE